MNSKKIVLGVVAGLAVGALLGVLFAPDNGKNIRKKIAGVGEDLSDGLKDKFRQFIDGLIEKVENTKEDVSNFAENASETFEQVDDVSNQN